LLGPAACPGGLRAGVLEEEVVDHQLLAAVSHAQQPEVGHVDVAGGELRARNRQQVACFERVEVRDQRREPLGSAQQHVRAGLKPGSVSLRLWVQQGRERRALVAQPLADRATQLGVGAMLAAVESRSWVSSASRCPASRPRSRSSICAPQAASSQRSLSPAAPGSSIATSSIVASLSAWKICSAISIACGPP